MMRAAEKLTLIFFEDYAAMTSREDDLDLWTAADFLNSVEPQRMERENHAGDCSDLLRRADGVAVMEGHAWSQTGKYPIAVWIKAYTNFS